MIMTVEEKAKAYDIIVQRVTELYETGTTLTKEQMEHLFPELRESEDDDERIRMRLTEVVLDIAGGWPFEKYGITKKEALAYLEKQKEQKPVWSEEDERMLSRCIKSVESSKNFAETQTFKEAKDKEKDWLKSLPERLNLQPKQEWSEEDEMKLGAIITDIETRSDLTEPVKIKYVSFLKSLRPSWKPSEEQMDRLFSIVAALRKDYCDDMADFLASLYEQLKKLYL